MSAPKPAPVFDPSVPMTAKWRSDIAWRLANGWTWKELAETLSCDQDELRFATECDPEFARVQEAAWARVTFDGEADAMRKLRIEANNGEGARAERAREVLARYAAELRHEQMQEARDRERRRHQSEVEKIRSDTKLAVEKMRREAKIEVEKLRNERAALKAQASKEQDREEEWVGPPRVVKETEEEFQKRVDREHAERAAEPEAKVYVWGGGHQLGRSIPPGEGDLRVRLFADWSVPAYPPELGAVYWLVPREANVHAPGPREAAAADALKEAFANNPPQAPDIGA